MVEITLAGLLPGGFFLPPRLSLAYWPGHYFIFN